MNAAPASSALKVTLARFFFVDFGALSFVTLGGVVSAGSAPAMTVYWLTAGVWSMFPYLSTAWTEKVRGPGPRSGASTSGPQADPGRPSNEQRHVAWPSSEPTEKVYGKVVVGPGPPTIVVSGATQSSLPSARSS